MNVPFAPGVLLPVPLAVAGVGVWVLARRLRARRGERALVSMVFACAFVIFGLAWSISLWKFSVDPIHGELLDGKTGAPIANARIQRGLYRVDAWHLGEGPRAVGVPNSSIETRSDSAGHFTLPGWVSLWPSGLVGLGGMRYVVYDSAHVPAYGCTAQPFHPLVAGGSGCGGFNVPSYPDPWVEQTWTVSRSAIRWTVSVRGRESPDDWAEAFHRTSFLVQSHLLAEEEFTAEAVAFAAHHPLNEAIVMEISSVEGSLGGTRQGRKCYKSELALKLLELREQYCKHHPKERPCNQDAIRFERAFLQERCSSLRR
jgi:hypothetical protein